MTGDFDDYWVEETKDYRIGTLSIYRSPKHPKPQKPKYGYKFVQTKEKKASRAKTKK